MAFNSETESLDLREELGLRILSDDGQPTLVREERRPDFIDRLRAEPRFTFGVLLLPSFKEGFERAHEGSESSTRASPT